MGLLINPKETERIDDLPGGEGWVEIRKTMTVADRAAVNSRAIKIMAERLGRKQAAMQMTVDSGAWGLALLERMVVAWSDDAPVSPVNIGRMSERDGDHIRSRINDLNPQPDAEEERDLSPSLSSPLEAEASEPERVVEVDGHAV